MSRKVRLSFAAPLVVTLAVAPACLIRTSSAPAPGGPATTTGTGTTATGTGSGTGGAVTPTMNPPRPIDPTTPAVPDRAAYPDGSPGAVQPGANPAQQGGTPPSANLGSWTVFQNANDQQCYAQLKVSCPAKPATCNPPPPRVMDACPTGISLARPIQIVEESPAACYIHVAAPACPTNVACNPPRPQKTACPS